MSTARDRDAWESDGPECGIEPVRRYVAKELPGPFRDRAAGCIGDQDDGVRSGRHLPFAALEELHVLKQLLQWRGSSL